MVALRADCSARRTRKSGLGWVRMRQTEAPFRPFPATYGPSGRSRRQAYSIVGTTQRLRTTDDYCFASGAASTALQAAGSDAIVIGGLGFGGVFGGFG
jgi:hypothetical protein